MTLNREQISEILPHREPFMFVDRVKDAEASKWIEAELDLNAELPFFKGHFPGDPIMPGVLTCEALAQTCGLLLSISMPAYENGKIFYLASSNIKYTDVVRAGQTLTLKATLHKSFQGLAQFSVEALAGKTTTARGTIVLAESGASA